MKKLLQPQYVGKFACIGGACEDSCCVGWRVTIDKETYHKYRACPDESMRALMDEQVTRTRGSNGADSYAKVRLRADGSCPFLSEEKLCLIQQKLGEQYLSNTCANYPRTINQVNDALERSLTMSCPEAARLALMDEKPMEFDEIAADVPAERLVINKKIDASAVQAAFKPERYFWELRVFIVSLLQDRRFPLWVRLAVLGLFCQKLDELARTGQSKEITVLIGTYLNRLDSGVLAEELANVPGQPVIQMLLVKELADERIFAGVTNRRFLECFAEFLLGLNYTADAAKDEIGARYAEAGRDWYLPFIAKHGHMLEHYLVNYVFKTLFPFSGEKHVFDNYVLMAVHYAMLKVLLTGMAAHHKDKLGAEHALKLIQSFAKVVEHNNAYLKNVIRLLKDNKFDTLAHMVILVRD